MEGYCDECGSMRPHEEFTGINKQLDAPPFLCDGHLSGKIRREKENERLRREVDAILKRIDGECGWASCEHADHRADIETLRSAIKVDE